MRLALIVSSLSAGGAEHVMAVMANYWAARHWPVTIFTFEQSQTPSFYDLSSSVRHVHLNLSKTSGNAALGILNNVKRIRKIRSAIKRVKPDVIISCMDTTNVITLLATRGLRVPVI